MATKNYGFPTIDPAAPFNGAGDVNALASAIDRSMKSVENLGRDGRYTLPAATKTKLGGVIIGDSVNINAAGVISVDVEPYELPPASRSTLGGVKIPKNTGIDLASDGTISVDTQHIELADGSVTTAKIADDAVTTAKIAANAVTNVKLSSDLQNYVTQGKQALSGQGVEVPITAKTSSTFSNITVKAYKFLTTVLVEYDLDVTSTGSRIDEEFAQIATSDVAACIACGHVDIAQGVGSLANRTVQIYTQATGPYNVVKVGQTTMPAGTYHLSGAVQLFIA